MLRTTFVLILFAFGMTQALRSAFYALLFYLFLAYFRPETWLWYNFVSDLNLSLIVGIYVVFRWLLAPDRLRFNIGWVMLLLFVGQGFISTMNSVNFDWSWLYYTDLVKAVTMGLVIITLVNTEQRLRTTLIVIALSLGFEATKQGWWQFFTNPGGENLNKIVIFGDNNGVAVGIFMLAPIVLALGQTSGWKWEKIGYRFAAVGIIYRGIATYSRGGFLSAAALGLHYLMRSKRKLVGIIGIVLVTGIIVPIMPDRFWERMQTIDDAAETPESADGSIQGRLHFWGVALTMAADRPLTGVGYNAYNKAYNQYDPARGGYGRDRSVHSSWLGVLSETGYPGFFLYLMIILHSLWRTNRVGRLAKKHPELKNLGYYAAAVEAGIIVFCVGGTFVIFQYNEMLLHLFAFSIAIQNIANDRVDALTKAPQTRQPVVESPAQMPAFSAARSAAYPRSLSS